MTNEKMEQRLASAVEKTAPNDVNGVLSRCDERKGTVIPFDDEENDKETVDDAGGGLPCAGAAGRRRDILSAGTRGGVRGVAGRKPQHRAEASAKAKRCWSAHRSTRMQKAILADMSNGADLKGASWMWR